MPNTPFHPLLAGTLLMSGLAAGSALAAQVSAPLPLRLVEAPLPREAGAHLARPPRATMPGGKAPGLIAPSPEGAPPATRFTANFDGCERTPPAVPPPPPYLAPQQFTVHDVDNRMPDAGVDYITEAWIVREDLGDDPEDCVMLSTSWYSPAGTADDWAAFPTAAAGKITPTQRTRLSWNAKAKDPDHRDGYEVRYSTAGTAVADFLAHPPLYANTAEDAEWTARQLDLGALAGTPIHLAFRNTSTDMFVLAIDDILVREVAPFDPELTAIDITGDAAAYGALPAWLGMSYGVTTRVRNAGHQALTGVTVDADMLADTTVVQSGTSSPLASLPPNAAADASVLAGALDTVGRWTVEATANAVEGDDVPENASAAAYVVHVTADEITRAVPDERVQRFLGIGAETGGELGNDFAIASPARLVAVRYTLENLASTFSGRTLQATVRAWDVDNDRPGELLRTLDTVVPVDAPEGTLSLEFAVPGELILTPGRFLIAAVEPTDPPTLLTLHLVAGRHMPGTSWAQWPSSGGWRNFDDLGSAYGHPVRISAVLLPPTGVPVARDDAFVVAAGSAIDGDVAANDVLSDDGGNVWTLATGPTHGTLAFDADGSFTYTPDAGFLGDDGFTYELCDADADCSSASATIDVVDADLLKIFADGFESQ